MSENDEMDNTSFVMNNTTMPDQSPSINVGTCN